MNVHGKKSLLFLLIIVFFAFYLRMHGINYGLPYVLNPEESNHIAKILYLLKHFLNPHCAAVPGFFLYLGSIIALAFSHTFNASSLISVLEISPSDVFVPLRVLNVLFGVGSVLVIYLIGNIFSTFCALLASGFLSVSLLHVMFSQLFLPYSGMTFFVLLSLYFALKAFNTKKFNFLRLAVVFASLSSSMHYIGSVSLIPILFVVVLNKGAYHNKSLQSLLVLFFTLSFILNPYFIFYFFYLIKFIIKNYIAGYYYYKSSTFLLYLFNFLTLGLGPVIWLSAFAVLKYRSDYDLSLLKILFSLPVFYFGLLGFFHLSGIGYAVLLMPYFCLASALFFNSLYAVCNGDKKFVFIVLILFAVYIPLKYTLRFNKLISLSDTRAIATEWIKKNTSQMYKIIWDKNSIQINWHNPYEPESLSDKRRFIITPKLLEKKHWLGYLRKKVDYAVINSLDVETVLRNPDNSYKKKYYTEIQKLKPVITFNPYLLEKEKEIRHSLLEDLYIPFNALWQRERAGPLIKVYKL